MPAKEFIAAVDKIVKSRNGRKIDMELSLDLCDLVKLKTGNARPVLARVAEYINGNDKRQAFFALNLLEVLMLNGGYPVRFIVSRKEWLNKLVHRFPPGPRRYPDDVEEYIGLLLCKWAQSLSESSLHKEEYANFNLMKELLSSKGFKFPSVPPDEIVAMLADESRPILTPKEETLRDEKIVLETKLEYHLSRKEPDDIKKANELIKVLSGYEDRAWKDEVLNEALQGQLDELMDKLDNLAILTGTSRSRVEDELRSSAPRLAHLAQSESLPGALLNKVLSVNDRLLKDLNIEQSATSEIEQSKSIHDLETNNHFAAHDMNSATLKDTETEAIHVGFVKVRGKEYLQILNHSNSVIYNLAISEDCQIRGNTDFLAPDETFTLLLKDCHKMEIMYKGLQASIKIPEQ